MFLVQAVICTIVMKCFHYIIQIRVSNVSFDFKASVAEVACLKVSDDDFKMIFQLSFRCSGSEFLASQLTCV